MGSLVPIVEGFGEIEAVPIVLRKLLFEREIFDLTVDRPINAHGCGNLTGAGGIEKFVQVANYRPNADGILVLIDTDTPDTCPVDLAVTLAARIGALNLAKPIAVVCAKREYEAWFLASLESIRGHSLGGRPGLPADLQPPPDAEAVGSPKAWISQRLPDSRVYKETLDQAPMSERIDLNLARANSRSFRRLDHAVDELIEAIVNGTGGVTPTP